VCNVGQLLISESGGFRTQRAAVASRRTTSTTHHQGIKYYSKVPTLVFFVAPTKPLQTYTCRYRQARTGDTVLVMRWLPW